MIADTVRKRKLPQDYIDAMAELRDTKMTYKAIGEVFSCSAPAVYWVLHPERRREAGRTYRAKRLAPAFLTEMEG